MSSCESRDSKRPRALARGEASFSLAATCVCARVLVLHSPVLRPQLSQGGSSPCFQAHRFRGWSIRIEGRCGSEGSAAGKEHWTGDEGRSRESDHTRIGGRTQGHRWYLADPEEDCWTDERQDGRTEARSRRNRPGAPRLKRTQQRYDECGSIILGAAFSSHDHVISGECAIYKAALVFPNFSIHNLNFLNLPRFGPSPAYYAAVLDELDSCNQCRA
jgi:hypothetical protein